MALFSAGACIIFMLFEAVNSEFLLTKRSRIKKIIKIIKIKKTSDIVHLSLMIGFQSPLVFAQIHTAQASGMF